MRKRKAFAQITAALVCCGVMSLFSGVSASEETEASVSSEADVLPAVGESISGFTLTELGQEPALGADLLAFHHEKSGADLVYIKNDDTNLGFSIGYRTPLLSEAGFNHVFEHAITAASKKYPSTDIFYDMSGSTYYTFLNAFTDGTYTCYPISSMSEEQIKKMADVYLDCMVEPLVMEDENYFRREAMRYQLYDKEDPITVTGIVYSEDYSYLTDRDQMLFGEVMRALNPSLPSCYISKSYRNIDELTYDELKKTYDRFYHFDNALIVLYGDMDYRDFLEYLDKDYLSKAEAGQTATEYFQEHPAKEEYTEQVVECPAYEGDSQEPAIAYAIDLGDADWTELWMYDMVGNMLTMEQSPLNQKLREAGLTGNVIAGVSMNFEEHYFVFALEDTDRDAARQWKQIVDETIAEMTEDGLADSLAGSVADLAEMGLLLRRENNPTDLFAYNLTMDLYTKWAQTGKMDGIRDYSAAVQTMQEDPQGQIRAFAQLFQDEASRALITVVPTPGLAEEVEQKQEEYLADLKASMTDEELDQMIADTLSFDEWNGRELSNHDFMISAEDLPLPEELPAFEKEEADGFTSYASETDMEGVSYNKIVFSTDMVGQEELHDLALYALLVAMKAEEKADSIGASLYGLTVSAESLNIDLPEANRPVFSVSWYARPEDYAQSLEQLRELLRGPLCEDGEDLAWRLDAKLPELDESLTTSYYGYDLARELTGAHFYPNWRYNRCLNGQEFYEYVKGLLEELEADPQGAAEEIRGRLDAVRGRILTRDGLTVANVAAKDALAQLQECNRQTFADLAAGVTSDEDGEAAVYDIPLLPQKQAVSCSMPMYEDMFSLPLDTEEFPGRYIPYVFAMSESYLTPTLRFQNGAYGGYGTVGGTYLNMVRLYSEDDPNVKETYEIFETLPETLRQMELTDEELEGYIITAYGFYDTPKGTLQQGMDAITYDMAGVDYELIRGRMEDILHARLEDKDAFAALLEEHLEDAAWTTVGNAQKIRENAELFDSVTLSAE